MIHAPGRCVPHIISFLKQHLTDEHYNAIYEYQQLIVKSMQQSSENRKSEESEDPDPADQKSEIELQLEEKMNTIKTIALESKKQS